MLDLGQRAVSTTPTFVTTMPPGVCALTLVANGTAATITVVPAGAVAPGTVFTVGTGAMLPANVPVTYPGFPASRGADVYAIAASGSVTVSYLISTAV
jgi:hypothetical protein